MKEGGPGHGLSGWNGTDVFVFRQFLLEAIQKLKRKDLNCSTEKSRARGGFFQEVTNGG
jgi:hypothetical protein